jgi:hypothetical protein
MKKLIVTLVHPQHKIAEEYLKPHPSLHQYKNARFGDVSRKAQPWKECVAYAKIRSGIPVSLDEALLFRIISQNSRHHAQSLRSQYTRTFVRTFEKEGEQVIGFRDNGPERIVAAPQAEYDVKDPKLEEILTAAAPNVGKLYNDFAKQHYRHIAFQNMGSGRVVLGSEENIFEDLISHTITPTIILGTENEEHHVRIKYVKNYRSSSGS